MKLLLRNQVWIKAQRCSISSMAIAAHHLGLAAETIQVLEEVACKACLEVLKIRSLASISRDEPASNSSLTTISLAAQSAHQSKLETLAYNTQPKYQPYLTPLLTVLKTRCSHWEKKFPHSTNSMTTPLAHQLRSLQRHPSTNAWCPLWSKRQLRKKRQKKSLTMRKNPLPSASSRNRQ